MNSKDCRLYRHGFWRPNALNRGAQKLHCLLPEEVAFFLPPLPRQGFDVSFENLQHLLEHSDSLRNLLRSA